MLKVAEAVLAGHPDKLCDQVADAIVDEFLRRDTSARVNIEVFGGHGAMMISGGVTSRADFDVSVIAKRVYKDAGYTDDLEPFVHLGAHTSEWTDLVAKGAATDQAVCYGYATKATREMLPASVVYANALARKIDEARQHDAMMKWLRPDGRVLVAMRGREVSHVSIFAQHDAQVKVQEVQGGMLERVIAPVIGSVEAVKLFVNPAGPFTQGGLAYHTGQSGRRVGADLYGGLVPQGNISLCGKDPRHPARAGSYMARHIAKSLVASGRTGQALVKLVYTIGRVDPIIFEVTGDAGEDFTELLRAQFDLKISSIVQQFQLEKPMYRTISSYGQLGAEVPWEAVTDLQTTS